MCLSDNELFALGLIPLMQLARLCLVLSLPESRANLHFGRQAAERLFLRVLLYTIPVAATIKLVHDWIGFGHHTICMGRIVFLLGTALLCAATEIGAVAPQQAATDFSLDIETRHPWRIWGFRFLLGAVWFGLYSQIPFK